MEIIRIDSTDSTNSWLRRHADGFTASVLVYALTQTAGRGQRGNSWESEPGMNLTASALLFPVGVLPRDQFCISEAVALAVVDTLESLGVEAKVKWPNDIYAGDRKICGILIENAVTPSTIVSTIAGIGINLNQEIWLSDAPNPVSVKQITGESHDIAEVSAILAGNLEKRLRQAEDTVPGTGEAPRVALHREYMSRMWRGEGSYPFHDVKRGEMIDASVAEVAPDGTLTLDLGSERRCYTFKEVEFILDRTM